MLDPEDERATATHLGGLTLPELQQFLDRGERGLLAKAGTSALAALARADDLMARGLFADAARVYAEALRAAGRPWAERDRTIGSFTWAAMSDRQWKVCAETAAAEAPSIARNQIFGRVILAGLMCVNQEHAAQWADTASKALEPLAAEAIALAATLRDHRFQLYQQLMHSAELRGDRVTVKRWGDLWLKELDVTAPANDDERSALDIARTDAASALGEAERVIPALIASERAMPANYNASLRLAQMLAEAKRYTEAIAACDRGLDHATGPLARAWLLETKADALMREGDRSAAHRVLQDALVSAREIGVKQARDGNIEKIMKALNETETGTK